MEKVAEKERKAAATPIHVPKQLCASLSNAVSLAFGCEKMFSASLSCDGKEGV